jgi:hypothetical protein
MTQPSSKYSRRLYVAKPEMLTEVRVLGLPAFPLAQPFFAQPGVYRADLDPNTGTATIRAEEAS